ncbi:prominin-1-A [Anabrus simplex]|uniref:prominin-1-A n=1 Tax=Anabrus simplex TaxID=316456 RepID=UPI0035A315C5
MAKKSVVKVNESISSNIQQSDGFPPTEISYTMANKSVVKVNESISSNIQQSGGSPATEKSYTKVRKSVVLVNESHTSNIQQSGGSPPTEKSFNKVSKPPVKVNESLISNVQQADVSPPPGKSYKVSKSVVKVDASPTSDTNLSRDTYQRPKLSISDEAFDSSSVAEKPYSVTDSSSPLPSTSTQNSVPATSSTRSKNPEDVDELHMITKQESSHKTEGCETKESIKELQHISRSNISPPSSSAAKIDKDVPIIKEVCHAAMSSKVISSLDAHVPEKENSDNYENQVKLSDDDSQLFKENETNETKAKEEEIKVSDLKTVPNARALQKEKITEHEVHLKITENPNGGRINDIKITSVQEDVSDEKGDDQWKVQHEKSMTSTFTHTEKYAEEQLLKPLRLQSEPIKTRSGDENTLSNEATKLESQTDNVSVQGVVENKLIINNEDSNGQEVETQQGRNHLQVVTETSVSDEAKAEALEQGDFTSWKQKRTHRNPPDESPTKSPALEFPAVPEGDSFRIHELGLSEGLFVFSYLGSFLSWMQPYDFPVELLRDALWNRLSIVSLITQSLQVEMGFIACLCIGVLLALAAPFFLMIHACCSLVRRSQSSNTWEDDTTSSSDNKGNCRRRTLVFLLQTILLLLVAGIVAMFVTNEQLSSAVQQTPKVVHTALSDVTTFLRNSNLQLNFVVTKSLDQAVETASADLDNIENLLGRPIQRELEAETGVDVALDALVDVTASAQTLSNKVNALHEYCGETRGLALVAQERLADLRHQVDMLRRQCPTKDRALCETVEGSGLDVVLQLDSLLNDRRLAGLRRLSQSNLSQVTQQARGEFQFIPMHVEKETREARNGVRRQLLRQRSILDDSVWSIEAITRDLGVRVEAARDRSLEMVRGASDMEQWRYLTGIGAAVAVLLIWVLLVGAISCGCCGAEDKARPTLLVTVGVLCPLYLALWALAMVALLVGGHGEVFVCRPLYDEPGYGALTKLMDKPGVLFQRGGGFFSSLLYGNDSLNVPLKDVLMACQQNRPSYPAFRLHQVFDVDSASDHHGWEALHRQLAKLEVNLTDLQLLTPDLQRQLQELLTAASVNLTSHRVQLSGPVTGKDLLSFSDQLESVANQITDLATASRMETLATRTRRLLASHIAPLTQRKEDMVYQLTSLEVQLMPLQRQVNQSLSHLKTIQFFINNQGANISHIKSQEYISRIVGYLQQYRDHVLDATATYVAPCRPVWDLFHAMRVLFCRHVMDPLNGFWFATVWCLLLLLVAIPLCIKLAACYRQSRPGSLLPRSHTESPPEAAIIPDPPEPSRPWATPGETEQEGW